MKIRIPQGTKYLYYLRFEPITKYYRNTTIITVQKDIADAKILNGWYLNKTIGSVDFYSYNKIMMRITIPQ